MKECCARERKPAPSALGAHVRRMGQRNQALATATSVEKAERQLIKDRVTGWYKMHPAKGFVLVSAVLPALLCLARPSFAVPLDTTEPNFYEAWCGGPK